MTETKVEKTVIDTMRDQLGDPFHAKTTWDGRNVDPLVQWIVNDVNRSKKNQHPVTFTVGGNLVSGILVSADAYFEQLAVDFSAFYESVNGSDEIIKKQVLSFKLNLIDTDAESPPVQFVHLKNAEIFTSNGRPIVSGGSLWRGKISSIDGFSLGKLTSQ